MKIKPEHFEVMQAAIWKFESENPELCVKHKKSVSLERYAWDVANAAGLNSFFCSTIYEYANDSHIQTALLKIVG